MEYKHSRSCAIQQVTGSAGSTALEVAGMSIASDVPLVPVHESVAPLNDSVPPVGKDTSTSGMASDVAAALSNCLVHGKVSWSTLAFLVDLACSSGARRFRVGSEACVSVSKSVIPPFDEKAAGEIVGDTDNGSGMGSEEWSQWKVLAEIFPPLPLMILGSVHGTDATSDALDAVRRPDASDASAGSVHGTDATLDAKFPVGFGFHLGGVFWTGNSRFGLPFGGRFWADVNGVESIPVTSSDASDAFGRPDATDAWSVSVHEADATLDVPNGSPESNAWGLPVS
eukprot:s896_g6.t1